MVNQALGIAELIKRLKQDLLAEQAENEPDLFTIDEITVEVNFIVTGDIDSGFNFGVVTLGSDVSEERVQKVVIKMTPLISKQQLIELLNGDPQKKESILQISRQKLVRTYEPQQK